MLTVSVNGFELNYIALFRFALSEESVEQRKRAIVNVKLDAEGRRIELLRKDFGDEWSSEPENAELVSWIIRSSSERHEALYELQQTARRYEDKNERKLNIAEEIGKRIWDSAQAKEFRGVQAAGGILDQVRHTAKEAGISGGRDKDTLRKIWNTYRGVVHLGMAIDYCEENPALETNEVQLAEVFRRGLSEYCPKGTTRAYVNSNEQIHFTYLSKLWGPRFRNRGLPFGVT